MFDINSLIRKNIHELVPYSSAREEFSGEANIWLDANENPFDTDLNRYPDPYQSKLKKAIAKIKGVETNQIFVGNGSDEAIDLLFRAFCEPKEDKAFIFPPTYGMYQVSAKINNVEIVKLPLNNDFELPDIGDIASKTNAKGVLFICSPNNPTGNIFSLKSIQKIAKQFSGLVVVDEAYIDFTDSKSAISLLSMTSNIVVLQTMSKAYGLAGLRLGMAFAHPEIIAVLNKIKPPYNVNTLSQVKGLEMLQNSEMVKRQITQIKAQREMLIAVLKEIKIVKKVFPTEANFILALFENAETVFTALQKKGIIIRNRTSQIKDALRITVGTPTQNEILLNTLKALQK
ncbi:MAG: histidinol-phosphate transaminase [Chitinophagales bacterium]